MAGGRTAAALAAAILLGCGGPRLEPTHRGLYLRGALNAFTPCGTDRVYLVEGSDPTVRQLQAGSSATAMIVRPVYIEVRGHMVPRGAMAEYHGLFHVDTLLAIKARRPADCGMPKPKPEEP